MQRVYGDPTQIKHALIKYSSDPNMSMNKRKNIVRVAVQLRKDSKNQNFSKRLKKIKQPTLVVWGEKDNLTPAIFAERLNTDIPNTELVLYPNAGHIPMEEIPLISSKDYQKFLQRYPLAI